MAEEENFEKADAGASLTEAKQASHLKKGDFAMLKGLPCKVIEMTTAKAGKHGAAKASITGDDIFTKKRVEDSCPSTSNIDCPIVKRTEYTLIDIAGDGFLSLMSDNGDMKEDLKLPDEEHLKEFVSELKAAFEAGKELLVNVVSALGREQAQSFRETNK